MNTQKVFNYSMIVATQPEPTVRPPSRSVGVAFRNLFVTVFAVFCPILWLFYLLFMLFPMKSSRFVSRNRGNILCITPSLFVLERHHFVHLWNSIAWSKRKVNQEFHIFDTFVRPSKISGWMDEQGCSTISRLILGWTNER